MLYPTLLFLLAVAVAATYGNRECRRQVWKECDTEKVPREIPETMEDLMRDCLIMQDILKCIAEKHGRCESDDNYTTHVANLLRFLESSCTEESSLYQAISRNYECIQPIAGIAISQCEHSDEDLPKIQKLIYTAGEAESAAIRCGYYLYQITCTAHVIGVSCGQEAKDAATEILHYMKYQFQSCNNESTLRKLQPLKELFESTFTEAPEPENELLEELKESLDK